MNDTKAVKAVKIKKDNVSHVISILSYIMVTIFAVLCLLPFIMMVSASFSNENTIMSEGVGFLPKNVSLTAYKIAFSAPQELGGAYLVTIGMTAIGTPIGLFLIAMTGYVLQRKDFFLRNKISYYIYFTTLFSAGLAPTYLWIVRYLNLKNNYLAVLLPAMMTPWLIFLMKNFMKSIPFEVTESGKIDGAGDFRIFVSLILPMLKPALATVGLFLALSYWNEWYNAMLYLPNVKYTTLQYYLYKIVNTASALKQSVAGANVSVGMLPTQTLKMATAVLATGPIIFLYPFVQKYFISGITVGAVKG
ncbi:MAG: carbohydrate ABC transporter permease [Oscillospiraceae bacterium]|jgi:ABC-type glycerol-3-phosphate transport system permease component|nr:carbohydrate ABC transporter permease [Oscillospiraceae bacterium]